MSKAQDFLRKQIDAEILLYYKNPDRYPQEIYDKLLIRWSDDTVYTEKHRFDLLNLFIPDLKKKKILDMASGCGSFVLQGLLNGYNTYGVEPEDWKHQLIDLKFEERDFPKEWRDRLPRGVGEKLPYDDETFDVFDSWQTIEHVGDERDCLFELYRVLKKGGQGILRGPSYVCAFEGHYKMLWLPLMGEGLLARLWLKLFNRPTGGLATFHPVNPWKTRKHARDAGFRIVNIKRAQIYAAAKRRMPILKASIFKPVLFGIYTAWDVYRGIRYFGRREATVSYLLIKD